MGTRIQLGAVTTAMATVISCASHHEGRPPPEPAEHSTPSTQGMPCPMAVAGAELGIRDTPEGVALTFTTDGDVGELRRRVHALAEVYESHQHDGAEAHGGGMHGMMHGGMMHGGSMNEANNDGGGPPMRMPSSQAAVTDVPDGATLTLTAASATDVESLRTRARQHVEMMRAGPCPGAGMAH